MCSSIFMETVGDALGEREILGFKEFGGGETGFEALEEGR
jgi:hypothetical protein